MKRLDDGKVSMVDFLRSIKFGKRKKSARKTGECSTHFADMHPRARTAQTPNAEDSSLVRSAN